MASASAERIQAREAAAGVLKDLKLEAFLFEVEAEGGEWSIEVGCESHLGWTTIQLSASKERLLASQFSRTVRRRMAGEWLNRLGVCRRHR
ncbi:hypothetical protein [Thiohalomonas denitrificans]|uniref:Uncharacterized protein n=1 Tax=Thiohalomonas denitrificans TaxID=415747 RepID=A0A1G5QS26_9GAMM|nr:hypothetical protein [Thiohalomonas denitrificans]SCZ64340.1 hypothetical protein SAMN03097708_02612 [Thiohalomonas denitrificans]